MSTPSNPPPVRTRSSIAPSDRATRIAAALTEADERIVAELQAAGFWVARSPPDMLEAMAQDAGAEAVLVDADADGAIRAIARLRRSESVVSTVPVVLIGTLGVAVRSTLDAVDAGADAFVPRPVSAPELVGKLRALLELPGSSAPVGRAPRTPGPVANGPMPVTPGAPGESRDAGELSPALLSLLRTAAASPVADASELGISDAAADVDELIPPELLEPLEPHLDSAVEEVLAGSAGGRRGAPRPAATTTVTGTTPTVTPLAIRGEMRLAGTLPPLGVGIVLGAAARARASGVLVLRGRGAEYGLTLSSGHLLSVRSSRPEDEAGRWLARLGAIPREAERFARVPLDAGVRGAAMLAARGYLSADVLAQSLARATRELVFDLIAQSGMEWEMRTAESTQETPLTPRALEALLVLGTRARVEPAEALEALGGLDALVQLRAEITQLATLPLTRPEREAAEAMRGVRLNRITQQFGETVAPAILALNWLGWVRIEGSSLASSVVGSSVAGVLALERTRVRALVEASQSRDFLAMLGVTEWSSLQAAREALDARMNEVAALRSRHPDADDLEVVLLRLDELSQLLAEPGAWEQYARGARSVV